MMSEAKYIRNWEELKEVSSPTHNLKVELRFGSAWITSKNDKEDGWADRHYLSTHTFYGDQHEESTHILQSCGFNVELANWDKHEDGL